MQEQIGAFTMLLRLGRSAWTLLSNVLNFIFENGNGLTVQLIGIAFVVFLLPPILDLYDDWLKPAFLWLLNKFI